MSSCAAFCSVRLRRQLRALDRSAPRMELHAPNQTSTASSDATIKQVQQILADLGYAPGPIDGTLGDETERAVSAFQRDRKIAQNGTHHAGAAAGNQTRDGTRPFGNSLAPYERELGAPMRIKSEIWVQGLFTPAVRSRACPRSSFAVATSTPAPSTSASTGSTVRSSSTVQLRRAWKAADRSGGG